MGSSYQFVETSKALKKWNFFGPQENKVEEFLLSPPTKAPIEYILVGGPSLKNLGYKNEDGIHEKLLIIDQSQLLYTGRGYGNAYSTWQDLSFVLKGRNLIQEASQAYEDLWSFVEPKHPLKTSSEVTTEYGTNLGPNRMRLEQDQKEIVTELRRWLDSKTPSTEEDPSNPEETLSARVLHSDHLAGLMNLMSSFSSSKKPRCANKNARLTEKPDAIMEEVIRLVSNPNVKEIKFTTLALTPPPQLKKALMKVRLR